MKRLALIIGNSDGIGLAVTNQLLQQNWRVIGFSRSESHIKHPFYSHFVGDVQNLALFNKFQDVIHNEDLIDLCLYCVGIGEFLDLDSLRQEETVINVNLTCMVKFITAVIPRMIKQGQGHIIGLSSMADKMISSHAPSYSASKAGFSNYLEGLAFALKPKGVHVTNVRFGFVDTKMAKGDTKPFLMSTGRAAQHIFYCIDKKPIRHTAPKALIPIVKIISWLSEIRILFNR